jgi:hypothetical protein
MEIENLELLGIPDFTTENLKMFDRDEMNDGLSSETTPKEIDVDNFGDDLKNTCPRCKFEY